MAALGSGHRSSGSVKRVSPIKPGLTGARNWATAQIRTASYTRKGFMRLCLSVFILIGFIVFIGLWLGGFLPQVKASTQNFTQARLMAIGFTVDRIDVIGEGRLQEDQVRKALWQETGLQEGRYLFAVDMKTAQDAVESISWVDHAVVRRLWPNRIVVQIIERRPYALWQSEGVVKVVDAKGGIIQDADPMTYTRLPLFVGPDAAKKASVFRASLRHIPDIAPRITAMIYLDTGRWDIECDDGRVRVKLPADNVDVALQRLNTLHRDHGVLDRQIATIDLRLDDRITFAPKTPHRA